MPVPVAHDVETERPLVGRRVELAAIEQRLVPGAIVTLTGPGGVGKSRLAQATCAALGERLPDGAWLVPLGAVVDPAAIPDAIAAVLGLASDTTQSTIDRVGAALAPMRALVVLDGVEHLQAGRGRVAELARRAPQVAWLVTSRVPLGLPGEELVLIEPFELPPASVSPTEAASYVAVELFVARAKQADPEFALHPGNAADVVALCRLADGIPLAIELAAAQVRARPLGDIGAHLEAAGGAGAVRGAVAWSYGLLDEADRTLLRHLALFPAGESLRDARERLGHLSIDFTASIERLVASHLLALAGGDPPHFTMLETVRDFCSSISAEQGELEPLWGAALAHLVTFAERADEGLRGRDQAAWLAALDAAHDNLRAGLAHAVTSAPAVAMALAGRLAWYWYVRGHYAEGSRWLEAALDRAPPARDHSRLRALAGAGRLAFLACRYARAEELSTESRNLAVALRDHHVEADAEQLLASIARERGEIATARQRHVRSLTLWQALDDRREVARAKNYLTFLGWIGEDRASLDAAGPGWRDRAESEFAALGDREGLVWSLLNRGAIALHAGDVATARSVLARALAEAVAVRFQEGIAWSLNLAGLVSLARRERVQARAQLRSSLRVHRRLGDLWRCASVLEALAVLSADAGEPARAALLFGGAQAIRRRIGAPVPIGERRLHDPAMERVAAALGPDLDPILARGASLQLDEVVTLATGVAAR
jgi:non-specific serine/threonine protein kinase